MDSKVETEFVSIKISRELYDKVQNRVNMSNEEFKNVEDYITFLITEVVNDTEPQNPDGNAYTKEEEEEIKGRLKNLGYI
ncbi:MAG: hypothetical protein ACREAZ_00355 [Nitrososphaera sp.]